MFYQEGELVYDSQYENRAPKDTNQVQADIDLKTRFGGDAFQFMVFELDVKNDSEDSVIVSAKDIYLEIHRNLENDGFKMQPLDKTELLQRLKYENETVRKERRATNVLNAVFTGISVVALAVGPGVNAADAVFYSLESTSYLIEDARYYNLVQGSLEEQMKYIDEWVLEEAVLMPGEEESWDVLFPRFLVDADATLYLDQQFGEYEFDYSLFKNQLRR